MHSVSVGDVMREGRYPRRWQRDHTGRRFKTHDPTKGPLLRVTVVYSNGYDTELVSRRERFWAWLTGRTIHAS